MTIAELFVNLGIKGDSKAIKATKEVKTSLADVASSGLAAKAAIIGMMYGLERLMSSSAKTGTTLTQFAAFTGLSAENLQRWQYAAMQAGESSEELMGNVKAVQGAMTNMLTGHGAPEGMAMVANKVGFDANKARDTFYVLQKLQEYANKTKDTPDVSNKVLASFGLSEGTIAAMRRNSFRAEQLAKAPIYKDKEVDQLNKVDVAWANLGRTFEMAIGHLTAKHGMGIIADINKVVPAVMHMVKAFLELAEALKVVQVLGKVFEGWGYIFEGISSVVGGVKDMVSATPEDRAKAQAKFDMDQKAMTEKTMGAPRNEAYYRAQQEKARNESKSSKEKGINMTVHNHGVKDAKDGAHHVKKAVQDSFRQMHAQGQGS